MRSKRASLVGDFLNMELQLILTPTNYLALSSMMCKQRKKNPYHNDFVWKTHCLVSKTVPWGAGKCLWGCPQPRCWKEIVGPSCTCNKWGVEEIPNHGYTLEQMVNRRKLSVLRLTLENHMASSKQCNIVEAFHIPFLIHIPKSFPALHSTSSLECWNVHLVGP